LYEHDEHDEQREVGAAAAAGQRPTVKVTESVRKDTDTQTPSSENPICYVESTVGTDLGLPSSSVSPKVRSEVTRSLPTIKLDQYDGSTPLETHLAKFDNCSSYYGWTVKDRLCHLKASLRGQAGEVLWQLTDQNNEDDVIKLLRCRFGSEHQTERFRAELHSRRRKKGESIQSLYNEIRRLLALSFPGEKSEICEILGRDAFLTALGDPVLRVRVLDQNPKKF